MRDHATRSIVTRCGNCREILQADADDGDRACRGCSATIGIDVSGQLDAEGRLDGCPCCGFHTMAIQKDVNSRLGVAVVVIAFVALLFSGLTIPQMVLVLVGITLIDVVLLRAVVKRVLICYRCKAQVRGIPPGDNCRPFDLATWEALTPPEDDEESGSGMA